jgi:ribosomal protein L2
VEFNETRACGLQSQEFRGVANILSTSWSAELLAKLEDGELVAASVDRLIYANIREGFESPHMQKTISGEISLAVMNMQNVGSMMDLGHTPNIIGSMMDPHFVPHGVESIMGIAVSANNAGAFARSSGHSDTIND